MRALALTLLTFGCAPEPSLPSAAPVLVVDSELLPGEPPRRWPIEVAAARGHFLLPWREGSWRARLDDRDLDLGDGELLGVIALDGGFAIAFRDRIHFLDDQGRALATAAPDLDGVPVRGVASDGVRVAIVTTTVAHEGLHAVLHLVSPDGAARVELGFVEFAPRPFGDRDGFIIARFLVDSDGTIHEVPAPPLDGVRLFARDNRLTADGRTWVAAGGPIVRVGGDGEAAWVSVETLVRDRLLLFESGVYRGRMVPDGGWPVALIREQLLWESARGADRLLGDRVVIREPASHQLVVRASGQTVLCAWLDRDGRVRVSRLSYNVFLDR